MGAAAYVGRVGGLAVALGVGAAVATGQGVASASPTDSTSPTSESTTQESQDSGPGSGATPNTNKAPEPEVSTPEKTSTSTPRDSLKSATTRIAELGKALSTGGALTSKKVTKRSEQAKSEAAEEAVVDEDAEVVDPEESEVVAPPAPTWTPPTITDIGTSKKRSSSRPAEKPAEASISRVPAPEPVVVRTVDVVANKNVMADQPAEVLQRTASAVESATFESLSLSTTVREPAVAMMAAPEAPAPKAPLPHVVTNVLSVFGLGSLASDVPAVPFGSGAALALLAYGSRRETEQTYSLSPGPPRVVLRSPRRGRPVLRPPPSRPPSRTAR